MASTSDTDLTDDAFLGGALQLLQPRRGYRAGIDPVLLAASVPAKTRQTLLDLGCGVGTAMFCVGARVPEMALTGVEVQPDYADLARQNAERNGLVAEIITADIQALPDHITAQRYDHVILNPPYFDPDSGKAPTDAGKALAFAGDVPLHIWLEVAGKRLAPKGHLTVIHKADRLPDLLRSLPSHVGSCVITPLTARAGRDADRVIVQAKHGGRAGCRVTAPLILHDGATHGSDAPDYAADIKQILQSATKLEL